jgi:hypothetical protein
MKISILVVVLLVFSVGAQAGDWEHAPKFSDFPAKTMFKGKPAPVRIKGKKASMFRSTLRDGAKNGADFAGHYTVVVWGCGADSFSLAVVDAHDGKVYFPPFNCTTFAGGYDALSIDGKEADNPAYRQNSNLLIFAGAEDKPSLKPEDRSVQFWVFQDGHFKLVYSIPAPRQE